jgi:hypothetical protein|uniref:Uncharacterized protein n=1 Tax=viral metagenome TaxID=1070528 RepID=A0A6H1ZA08_9ZZZZ
MSEVNAKSIARLAYGYELMFQQLCHIAGTSGGSTSWYTGKGQEVTARIDPLWKLTEESNAHKPGDCLSQHEKFADWAASTEKRAEALEHWRQEVGKLHSQVSAKADEVERLRDALLTVLASLVATTSIIIRAEDEECKPSKAVASDAMLAQMLKDYDAATIKGRSALKETARA